MNYDKLNLAQLRKLCQDLTIEYVEHGTNAKTLAVVCRTILRKRATARERLFRRQQQQRKNYDPINP